MGFPFGLNKLILSENIKENTFNIYFKIELILRNQVLNKLMAHPLKEAINPSKLRGHEMSLLTGSDAADRVNGITQP